MVAWEKSGTNEQNRHWSVIRTGEPTSSPAVYSISGSYNESTSLDHL